MDGLVARKAISLELALALLSGIRDEAASL